MKLASCHAATTSALPCVVLSTLLLATSACSKTSPSPAATAGAPTSSSPAAGSSATTGTDGDAGTATALTGSACSIVYAAMEKLAATPTHQHMTESGYKEAPSTGESIIVGGMMYIQAAGKWHKMPYDSSELIKELRERSDDPQAICKYVRDETVAGHSTAVYAAHDPQEGGTTVDTQLWIARDSGLPLKQTIDFDVGTGATGKSHTDMSFDYSDVQAPAGV